MNRRSLGFARDDKGWGICKVYGGWQEMNRRSLDFARDDKGEGDASMKSGC
jgi:hypothetical protein